MRQDTLPLFNRHPICNAPVTSPALLGDASKIAFDRLWAHCAQDLKLNKKFELIRETVLAIIDPLISAVTSESDLLLQCLCKNQSFSVNYRLVQARRTGNLPQPIGRTGGAIEP